jgi:hypothetical protein
LRQSAPRETDNAPRETDNAPRETDNAPRETDNAPLRPPSPSDLAELAATFALTVSVHDPDPVDDVDAPELVPEPSHSGHGTSDETSSERGLRGLVGGGSSQVSVTAALRARDAARPTEADLATAAAELVIVRRGWVPRDDLPRGGARR